MIIGSGISGLSAANTLTNNNKDVLIIDKARNPGGRLSTRDHNLFSFDHGAQFFTTTDTEFNKIVQKGLKNKEITIFMHPKKGAVCIGNPVFKTFISRLTSNLNIEQNKLVEKIKRRTDKPGEKWCISIKNSNPIYANRIILTTPAPQAYELIPDFLTELKTTCLRAEYQPCIATLVGVELFNSSFLKLDKSYSKIDPILIAKGNIGWSIAKLSWSKRNTKTYLSVVIHANHAFSSKHIGTNINDLANSLWLEWKSHVNEESKLDGYLLPNQVSYIKGHKWRYARVSKTPDKRHISTNGQHSFALAGDWLIGPRIESAWISGRNAANSLL